MVSFALLREDHCFFKIRVQKPAVCGASLSINQGVPDVCGILGKVVALVSLFHFGNERNASQVAVFFSSFKRLGVLYLSLGKEAGSECVSRSFGTWWNGCLFISFIIFFSRSLSACTSRTPIATVRFRDDKNANTV